MLIKQKQEQAKKMARKHPIKKIVVTSLLAMALISMIAAVAFRWTGHNHIKVAAPGAGATTNPTQASDSVASTNQSTESNNSGNAAKSAISIEDKSSQSSSQGTDTLSVFITTVSQSGDPIQLHAQISGANSTPTCNATFTLSGQPDVMQSGNIVWTGQSYSCNVSVPVSNFGASGNWSGVVSATAGGSTKTSSSVRVEVTK